METRIQLRQAEPKDLQLLYLWENNTENWAISYTHTFFSKESLKNYLAGGQDIYKDKQARLMIDCNEQSIGCLDLFEFDPKNRNIGIGILIGNLEFRRKGHARKALELALKYCFEDLDMNNVFCHILSENRNSIALFESLGFIKQGVKKQWVRVKDHYQDELFFQLTKA